MIERYKAEGVIFCLQRFCDTHQFDLPFLIESLKAQGMPILSWEVEQNIAAELLRPQLMTFFEIIGGLEKNDNQNG